MFIQTQNTPNPQSLMFLPGKTVIEVRYGKSSAFRTPLRIRACMHDTQNGTKEFTNARAAMSSPLAKRLFAIDGVTSVFLMSESITVTKKVRERQRCPECWRGGDLLPQLISSRIHIPGLSLPSTQDDDAVSWAVLKPDVFAAIMDHFSSGDPVLLDEETLSKSDTAIHPEDDEVRAPSRLAEVSLRLQADECL